ncbi:MAG: hypothetical protein AAF927_11395 [Bacteroidota bacterium]
MNSRRFSLLMVLLLVPICILWAQDQTLLELNTNRLQLNKTNMYVLGAWAVGNIAVSGVLRSRTTGSTRYFHEMNVFWNVVNLGLAAGGLYGTYTTDPAMLSLWESYQAQQKLEKILLFNLALNFSYMTAGGFLIERAKNTSNRPERLKGYGQSLLLQGGFLLLFDTAQYLLHHNQAQPKLEHLLSHVQVGPQGIGLHWVF